MTRHDGTVVNKEELQQKNRFGRVSRSAYLSKKTFKVRRSPYLSKKTFKSGDTGEHRLAFRSERFYYEHPCKHTISITFELVRILDTVFNTSLRRFAYHFKATPYLKGISIAPKSRKSGKCPKIGNI